jgi:hypothetical protein
VSIASVRSAGLHAKSTLTTVINSLDKLVELERRITGLENDSLYDRMGDTVAHPHVVAAHAAEAVPSILGQPSALRFTKARTAASHGVPSKTRYSVQVVGKPRGLKGVGGREPMPRAGAALAALKGKGLKGKGPRAMGGRAVPRAASVTAPALNAGRSVSRVAGRAANTGSYNRVLHQDAAISGWLQQKKAVGRHMVKGSNAGRGRLGEGQVVSRSMQLFQDLRGQMDKRKGPNAKLKRAKYSPPRVHSKCPLFLASCGCSPSPDEMRRRLKQGGSSSAPSGTQGSTGTRLPPIGRSVTSSAGPARTRGSSVVRLPKMVVSNQQRALRRAW